MKRYGLLITKEKLNGDTIAIYKPIYSNDLKQLVNKKYEIDTNFKSNDFRIITEIFDYQKVVYVNDKLINNILLGKKVSA